MVHHGLKCCRGVRETEEHYVRFIQPIFGFEGCFVLISVFDPNVIVSPAYVEFRENVGVLDL